jgi:hydroxylysine kinase
MTSVKYKPNISEKEAILIAKTVYGLDATSVELDGERDQNFCLNINDRPRFVLKLSNLEEPRSVLEFQIAAQDRLATRLDGLEIPIAIPDLDGNRIGEVILDNGDRCQVRLLTYVEGQSLASLRPLALETREAIGLCLGEIDRQLEGFSHPAAHRRFQWNLSDVEEIILQNSRYVKSVNRRHILEHFLERFGSNVKPKLKGFRSGIIHNDGHDDNFVAEVTDKGEARVVGLVDFGDMVYGPYAYEAAIADRCYLLFGMSSHQHQCCAGRCTEGIKA